MPRAKGGSIKPPRVVVNPGDGGLISELNNNDVLSGRGGRINNHPGNITFRLVCQDYKHEYLDPRTRKLEKAHVAARLVTQIRSTNPPGRFLKEDQSNPGFFIEIGDHKAWKKAGQALREDAPDVRKEIDKEMEHKKRTTGVVGPGPSKSVPQNHQQPTKAANAPQGVPPSVSYSPNTQPAPLAPPSQPPQTRRGLDPPETEGITGYRQPPLNYFDENGRGTGSTGRPTGPHQGRGSGGPPQHHPPPPQHYHPGYPGHPPPQHYGYNPNMPPQSHQYHHPPQHYYAQQHQYHYPPQAGRPPSHFSQPYSVSDKKKGKRKKSPTPPAMGIVPAPVAGLAHQAVETVHGIASQTAHHAVDTVQGLTKMVTKPMKSDKKNNSGSTATTDTFPPTMSVATDFTLSDVSAIGESSRLSHLETPASLYPTSHPATTPERQAHQDAHNKRSLEKKSSKSSSGKTEGSFALSDISMSGMTNLAPASMNFSFGGSGRTRSFPDLMLSTGDYPLHQPEPPGDQHAQDWMQNAAFPVAEENAQLKTGGMLRPPMHRQTSSTNDSDSMASLTIKGFHPARGRTNTGLSGLNDALSIMSIDSKKSLRSDSSSWLDNFRSMQSIHSDANSLKLGDEASVRSMLSDMSNELCALDLAEPLLPPYQGSDSFDFNRSDDIVIGKQYSNRPDP